MAQVAKPIIIYMSKKITITLFDKELTLNFGVNYFYKYFKEATGIDLYASSFEIALKVDSRQKQVEAAQKANLPIPEENGFSITETKLYKMISSTDNFLYAAGILYAGYAAEKSVNREKMEFKYEDFEHIVYSMNESEVADILAKYNNTKVEAKTETAGEV